jgi:actin-like ATPase involved in cell morphogenesis
MEKKRCMREGGIGEFDLAEAMVRRELRKGASSWRLAPRVVVAAPRADGSKRGLKDVIVCAGARDLITIPKAMAAALGAGLAVDADQITTVLYIERDWMEFMVIRKSEIRVDWERAGGVDQLVEDVAVQMRTARGPVPDFERLHENLKTHGLVEPAVRAGATHFVAALRERCRHEAERLSTADQRDWRQAPLYLLGPYAEVTGLRELVAELWACEVIVPERSDQAVIRGCRNVLAELDAIMKSLDSVKKPSARQPLLVTKQD